MSHLAPTTPPGPLTVRVARKTVEAVDICSFELVDAGGADLPPFTPGSHIDVHLPNGLVRQYSLCNDPNERHRYLIAVLRDAGSRGGSRCMHDQLHEGDALQIGAPRNQFPLAADASHSVLLAGGIGVTPMLCMAERLWASGADFQLHYCTRSRSRTAFHDALLQRAFAPSIHFHFDDGYADQRVDLDALTAAPQPDTHVYVCGPRGFMDAVLERCRRAGWPEEQVHSESFSADLAAMAAGDAFEVMLSRSGRLVAVPAGQTVIQALEAVGVSVPTSCEQGVCGTCLTRVLDGEPDHRDSFLLPAEQARNDCFTPCCSRARSSRLVLDL